MKHAFSPEMVYLFFVLGGLLALVEAGLTTFGIAGVLAGIFGSLMAVGISANNYEWWPLGPAAISILICCIPLALHRRVRIIELIATVSLGAGSLLFAILNESVTTGVFAAFATGGFYFAADRVFRFVEEAQNAPSTLGMDALVGRIANVKRWSGSTGTVMIDGAYWNASGPPGLRLGHRVRVVSFVGMHLGVIYSDDGNE